MKQLFLSHFSGHANEVADLARELRFRGVRPWVDKQGGFLVADESAVAAERAICEDCLGLLLYATDDVFDREFIRRHEIPPALRMRAQDDGYLLFAVPRNLDFETLSAKCSAAFGADLSKYHTRAVNGSRPEADLQLAAVAADVSTKVLHLAELGEEGQLNVQFSTRERAPVGQEEALTIDGTEAYLPGGPCERFDALVAGLRDVKRAVSNQFGRPRLLVHGFKHLSAAFLFGRVFQPFATSVRQTPSEFWRLDTVAGVDQALDCSLELAPGATDLAVQVSSRFKDLTPAVNHALSEQSFHRLVLRPPTYPLNVDENLCATMVRDAYSGIERSVAKHQVQRIRIFAAAPQALMMGLGQRFAGMPETLVYDFNGSAYDPPKTVPGGIL